MKRKIAFISEHASPLVTLGGADSGGQNVYVGELSRNLARRGYEIDIFTRWEDKRLPQIVQWAEGVRVIHIKAGPKKFIKKEKIFSYMLEFASNMKTFIEKENIDYKLIHAHFWMSGYVAIELKKKLNIPFIVTFHALGKIRKIHQGKKDGFPAVRSKIEEQTVKEADKIIAECPQDRDDLIQYYNASKEKITVVPCGFNPYEFYPVDKLLARMVLGLNRDEKIILQLGRMVPRKGVDNVIEAAALLIKKHKINLKVLIVGGETDEPDSQKTPEIGRLQKLAQKNQITEKVIFVGRKNRETLKYYYSAADVFISTPWYEPFGITPLEAMACGTPVIGSNVGGLKYSVINGKTGLLIPPKKPAILADKITEVLKNETLTSYFKENALKRVNSSFTWGKIAGTVAALYEMVILPKIDISTYIEKLNIVENNFLEASEIFEKAFNMLRIPILDTASAIFKSLNQGGKILVCGNGGSAAQASHFVGELVGRFQIPQREALPAISLSADTAVLTAWANDFSYDFVFARQVEAFVEKKDIVIGLSTSGNSKNVIEAINSAKNKNALTIAITGKGGGELSETADISIVVPSDNTQRIQETHLALIHIICELVEKQLSADKQINRVEDLIKVYQSLKTRFKKTI